MEQSQGDDETENNRAGERLNHKPRSSKVSRREDERSNRDIILDPWQKEALEYNGNFLLCTGRQVGKTTIMAIKASEYMIKNPGSSIIVCSLTEDQAQLIIVMTLDYLQNHYKTWIAKGKQAPTKNKIILTNKSSILARPVGNTGDAVRGFTGDVLILDEASRFNEFIFTASKPTLLTTGGQIWMCSTPFGKQGYFYECYLNKSGRFKVIETNSWDVVNTRPISESWTQEKKEAAIRFLEDEKKDMSSLQFSQEYLGKFIDDLRQLFSDELINRVCTLRREERRAFGNYFLGVDIARMGEDEGTYEVLDKLGNNDIRQVENIVTRKKLTTETYDMILSLERQFHFKKIGIDAGSGSLGVGILDFLLREPLVRRKVVALNNLSRDLDFYGEKKKQLLKVDMYQNLLAMLEMGKLKLLDDDNLRLSLKSVQFEYITKQEELSKVRIFGDYTHIVEGLIRAAWLANQKSLNPTIDWI